MLKVKDYGIYDVSRYSPQCCYNIRFNLYSTVSNTSTKISLRVNIQLLSARNVLEPLYNDDTINSLDYTLSFYKVFYNVLNDKEGFIHTNINEVDPVNLSSLTLPYYYHMFNVDKGDIYDYLTLLKKIIFDTFDNKPEFKINRYFSNVISDSTVLEQAISVLTTKKMTDTLHHSDYDEDYFNWFLDKYSLNEPDNFPPLFLHDVGKESPYIKLMEIEYRNYLLERYEDKEKLIKFMIENNCFAFKQLNSVIVNKNYYIMS